MPDPCVDTGPQLTVGVLGLGAMGSRFAGRLLDAGFIVHAWNRTSGRVPELDRRGLVRHDSPRELAAVSDVVLIMLWDSDAVAGVMRGESGILTGLKHGSIVVDLSTIEPHISAALARETAAVGSSMLDCPISGSLDRAANGTVMMMAGGTAGVLARVRPILDKLARTIVHVGDAHGSGLAIKLAINAQVATQLVAWGEAIALTDRFGIDRRAASEIMLESVIGSPMLQYRIPLWLDQPDVVWANVEQLRKDVVYAQTVAGPGPRTTLQALDLLDAAIASGRGKLEAAELVNQAVAHREGRGG